jgi:hypothetical protein
VIRRDLWAGADVRWVRWAGPARRRRGVRLQPGDRAVVVDAGRHQLTSFNYLTTGSPPRPRRGVTIRLEDGTEIRVPRRHLELAAPDHPLRPEPDLSVVGWWLDQLDEWGSQGVPVSSMVPGAFPAVAQVLHPWWRAPYPDGEPIRWREAAEQLAFASVRELDATRDLHSIPAAERAGLHAHQGELDRYTAQALVDVLGSATATADDVFVAVWVGRGDVPPQRFPGAAEIPVPGRAHFLLRGPLEGVLRSISIGNSEQPVAGIWWPADRAWFVATEIDFDWTFVAGTEALIERLAGDERLEATPIDLDAEATRTSDNF